MCCWIKKLNSILFDDTTVTKSKNVENIGILANEANDFLALFNTDANIFIIYSF